MTWAGIRRPRDRPPLRLVVDAVKCDGHGICVLRCPERLSLDRFGFAGVDVEDLPLSGRELRHARSAVAACPEKALTLRPAPSGDRQLREAHSTSWVCDEETGGDTIVPRRRRP